jgi:hypoxia up-regulated 1
MEKDKKDKAKKPLGKDRSTIPLEIEIVYNSQGPLSLLAKRAARERYVCIICAHKTDGSHAVT